MIDQILGHSDLLRRKNVSGAGSAYVWLTRVVRSIKYPQTAALDELARVLGMIKRGEIF
ncbi:MAG: hypothetical protein JJU15_06370 [Pararhodobacter sp.]|nr:hypothetical protein [Pararhodobacter sp.]